jgi:hypothetical protein
MEPFNKLQRHVQRAHGFLELYQMTDSEVMRQRYVDEIKNALNDKEIEEMFDRMAWEHEQERRRNETSH